MIKNNKRFCSTMTHFLHIIENKKNHKKYIDSMVLFLQTEICETSWPVVVEAYKKRFGVEPLTKEEIYEDFDRDTRGLWRRL